MKISNSVTNLDWILKYDSSWNIVCKYAPSIIQGVADKFWTTLYYIIILICQNTQVIHAVFNKERVFSFCLKNKEGLQQSVESHLKCFHPRRCLLRNCIALSRHQQQQKAKCFDQPSTPLQQQKQLLLETKYIDVKGLKNY